MSRRTLTLQEEPCVIRYVGTHMGRDGLRTMMQPTQGAYTYATRAEAQAYIDGTHANNGPERVREHFGLPLEVRAVPCWPGHFDPMTCYPPETIDPAQWNIVGGEL